MVSGSSPRYPDYFLSKNYILIRNIKCNIIVSKFGISRPVALYTYSTVKIRVFIRFKRGLFYCFSLVVLICLNQYEKQQVKTLVFELTVAKHKCDCLG